MSFLELDFDFIDGLPQSRIRCNGKESLFLVVDVIFSEENQFSDSFAFKIELFEFEFFDLVARFVFVGGVDVALQVNYIAESERSYVVQYPLYVFYVAVFPFRRFFGEIVSYGRVQGVQAVGNTGSADVFVDIEDISKNWR